MVHRKWSRTLTHTVTHTHTVTYKHTHKNTHTHTHTEPWVHRITWSVWCRVFLSVKRILSHSLFPGNSHSLWNKRPDDITFKMPPKTKVDVIFLMEFSLRSTLNKTMERQRWILEQISFITGVRSLNEEVLKKNLEFFKVPSTNVGSTRSKLYVTTYENI